MQIERNTSIKLVELSALVPYAKNSRKHPPKHVEQIANSIKEFGWTNPILIDGDKGIIAGHGRFAAAELLGLTAVPVIELTGLTEAQKRAYVVADNKLTDNSTFDFEVLKSELTELRAEGFDLSLTGFSSEELLDLLLPELALPDKDPDDAPEAPEESHSKLGDVWVMGPHRVCCGDSTSMDDWNLLMNGELADVCLTDPPYNVDMKSINEGLRKAGKARKDSSTDGIKNDRMSDDDFLNFLLRFNSCLFSVMKEGAAVYQFYPDRETKPFHNAFTQSGFKLSSVIVWKKNTFTLGRSDFQSQHEPAIYGWKPGSAHRWFGGRKQTSVHDFGDAEPVVLDDGRVRLTIGDNVLTLPSDAVIEKSAGTIFSEPKPKRSAAHPTMKPTMLLERLLKCSARRNDIVVDAFGGSGSTLMAAELCGMCARLIELDPRFVDVICARYAMYTGRLPVNEKTGEKFPQELIDRMAEHLS